MGKIQKVDPFLPIYTYEKQVNPEAKLVWRQYERKVVEDIDRILEIAHGKRDVVKTAKDWEVFGELLNFYAKRWPSEFREFAVSIKDIRGSRTEGGYSKSKEIMYVGAIPPRFMRIIRVIFPMQAFSKDFVWKMVNKFPLFRVAGVGNLSKGGVQL